MKTFTYTIKDELGIHARPAGMLAKTAKALDSEVIIAKDDKSAAATKLMAYQSYLNVTPALFETAFKYQYSKNPYDAELFEVIRDNVVFDIGRPFFDSLGGDQSSPIRVWRMQIENGNNTLSSSAKVQLRAWNKSLTKLTEELKADN